MVSPDIGNATWTSPVANNSNISSVLRERQRNLRVYAAEKVMLSRYTKFKDHQRHLYIDIFLHLYLRISAEKQTSWNGHFLDRLVSFITSLFPIKLYMYV